MVVSAYDSYVGTFITGYPAVIVDRSSVVDPSSIFSAYSSVVNNFGVADINLTYAWTGNNLSVTAKVTPTVATNADYRLALVLTEDRVSGTTSTWAQHNYYNGGGYGPLQNSEYNFVTLPAVIPATTMKYDFVGRGIYPSVGGAAGSLPTAMSASTAYNYTFPSMSIDTLAWNAANMKAVVMLVNNADGSVLNSQNIKVPLRLAINDVAAGVTELEIYPNPATDVVNAKFSLTDASSVTVDVLDIMGKTVKTIARQNMTAGSYQVPVNTASLSTGTYMIKITTDKGAVTQRVSIIK